LRMRVQQYVSCGKRFELLPRVNRADKQTCSQTCRTRVYRQRKQRALALYAEGKTARAIARELEAKLDASMAILAPAGHRRASRHLTSGDGEIV